MHPAWLVVRDFLFSSFIIVLLFMQLYEESGNSLDFKVFTSEIFVEIIERSHDISHHLWHFWYLSDKFCEPLVMKSSFLAEIYERIGHKFFSILWVQLGVIHKQIMEDTYISSFCDQSSHCMLLRPDKCMKIIKNSETCMHDFFSMFSLFMLTCDMDMEV